MNIVILGTAHPYRGGLATFNERLARQFQNEGHSVRIITFTLQYPSFLFPGKTQFTNDPAPEGLKITREINSCNPFNWIRIGRQLCKEAPDLVICCYWMAFFAPCYSIIEKMVKHNHKTRCIALVHNMLSHETKFLHKMLETTFAPVFVKSTDGFVALSESVVKDIEMIEKKAKCVRKGNKTFSPHPIYDHYGERMEKAEACRELGLDSGKQYMLFFGLVRAYKGLDLLLDAFGKIKDELPELQLLIAGEFYEGEEKYMAQIKSNGLTNRVVLRNEFIPDGDLRKYFGAADLIVQPYKSATQSGVTQVAFHFEKPMLVTNVGGLGEIVHDHLMGYAVNPDSQAIAEAIKDYFMNDRQADYTEYLKLEKSKYEWDKMSSCFEKM